MPIECIHALTPGQKCHAPAANGSSLCRHHDPSKQISAPASREAEPFVLPNFHDTRTLLYAVSEVLHAMSERRIKRSEGGTLLFGLQLASRLISDISKENCDPLPPGDNSFTQLENDRVRPPMQDVLQADAQPSCEPTIEEVEELLLSLQTGTVDPRTLEEVEDFLISLQSGIVDEALDNIEARQKARAQTGRRSRSLQAAEEKTAIISA